MEQEIIMAADGTKSIKPYEFHNHRNAVECVLPQTVKSLGSHCFFDCRSLRRLVLWDRIEAVEDGILKNCFSLGEIEYNAADGNMYALKSILSQVSEELLISIFYGEEKEKVILLFPGFLHDYEENTMARIINQVTYGSGAHYRECVTDEGIDYQKYDKLFSYALANEEARVPQRLALYRLLYPKGLWEEERKLYLSYILGHYSIIGETLIREGDMNMFQYLARLTPFEEDLEALLKIAQKMRETEYISCLLQVKRQRFGEKKQRFSL